MVDPGRALFSLAVLVGVGIAAIDVCGDVGFVLSSTALVTSAMAFL